MKARWRDMSNGLRILTGLLVALSPARAGDVTVDQEIRRLAQEAPLRRRFQGKTAKEAVAWQSAFGAKLRDMLGPHQPPAQWDVVVERVVELDDHRREELILKAAGHPDLPLYVLTPKPDAQGKRPGILALHGHGAFGADPVVGRELTAGVDAAIASANYDYGRQLVRRGYVVAAPCLTPFGRRLGDAKAYGKQDPCGISFIRMQLLGKLLIAENLRDALWSLEYLGRHPNVDPERLGCVGLSYGGRMTTLTAAVAPRIRVAVISGALNCMQERIGGRYSCGAQVIPGLLEYGDVPEIVGLIAPRPCLFEVGSKDTLLPVAWQTTALERVHAVYDALGAGDRVEVDRFEGGHRWHGERAGALLDQVLKR